MIRLTLAACAALALAVTAQAGSMKHDHHDMNHQMGDKAAMTPEGLTRGVVATAGPVTVSDAFAFANPAGAGAGAVFMTIATAGGANRVTAADSPAAKRVELHTHKMNDQGVMSMMQVPDIPFAADAPAHLQPGGHHVMLMGLVAPLVPGEQVEVTLHFEEGDPMTFTAPIFARGGMKH